MKLGVFAKTFYHSQSLDSLFETIIQHHISGVHFNMVCAGLTELPLVVPHEICQKVSTAANRHNIKIVGLSATFNMIHPDPSHREKGLESLNTLAAAAKHLGTDFISLCTGSRHSDKWTWHPENATADAWKDLLISMERALEIAHKHKIYLGVEPEIGNVIRNPQKAAKLLEEIESSRLRIILDPANLFEKAKNRQEIRDLIKSALDLLHPHIMVAHAKDRNLNGNIKAAGMGDVDFEFFFEMLKQVDFKGWTVLHGLEAADVPKSVNLLIRML